MSENAPDLGAMVSKLLGNPELISQIASTVGIETPPETPKKEEAGTAEAQSVGAAPGDQSGGIEALLPMLSMMGGGGKSSGAGLGGASRRCALLSALKPFCNEHRCKTIDYMIGISKLSETLIPNKRG